MAFGVLLVAGLCFFVSGFLDSTVVIGDVRRTRIWIVEIVAVNGAFVMGHFSDLQGCYQYEPVGCWIVQSRYTSLSLRRAEHQLASATIEGFWVMRAM